MGIRWNARILWLCEADHSWTTVEKVKTAAKTSVGKIRHSCYNFRCGEELFQKQWTYITCTIFHNAALVCSVLLQGFFLQCCDQYTWCDKLPQRRGKQMSGTWSFLHMSSSVSTILHLSFRYSTIKTSTLLDIAYLM